MTVRDALNSALDEEMTRDPSVYILGEEVRRRGSDRDRDRGVAPQQQQQLVVAT